ncbi:MAG: putative small membrane protein [Idiomarinaceae bacterium HL-53]|nr:MAG: putative small membrane protein [Idiomarinaceae bacterium HL-53]CUS49337.1 Uncharacterized membrane protein YgdD, TMEM256/DUF423 family [Idiomarinaceae bacterium HL-53]
MPVVKTFLFIGALILALGVVFGAFGAHALRNQVAESALATWQTAVLYQLVHGLGLLAVALLLFHFPNLKGLVFVGASMLIGTLLFSGSLYGLVLTEWRWLGPITPIGGLFFILAWFSLAYTVLKLPH